MREKKHLSDKGDGSAFYYNDFSAPIKTEKSSRKKLSPFQEYETAFSSGGLSPICGQKPPSAGQKNRIAPVYKIPLNFIRSLR